MLRVKLTLAKLLTPSNVTTVCFFLRKTLKDHYAKLDEKHVADNKQFWGIVKSDKVRSFGKITL